MSGPIEISYILHSWHFSRRSYGSYPFDVVWLLALVGDQTLAYSGLDMFPSTPVFLSPGRGGTLLQIQFTDIQC